MNFDDILERIGDFGCYQRLLIGLLYLPAIIAGCQALSYVFVNATPNHRCFVETCDNATTAYSENFLSWTTPSDEGVSEASQYSRCDLYALSWMNSNNSAAGDHVPSTTDTCSSTFFEIDHNLTETCHRWKYDDSTYSRTVITQWDLVCDRSQLVVLAQSVYMIGIMMGSIIFGIIADRFGRKMAMMIAITVAAMSATTCAFVPDYSAFLVLKFITGACGQGFYQSIFVISMEFVGKSRRAFCGLLVSIYFSIGEILLGVLAFFVRDWQHIQLIISAPLFLFISYIWIIPESPRWMISRKQYSGAKAILEKIAISNKRTVPYDLLNAVDADIVVTQSEENLKTAIAMQNHSFLSLFQTSRLRWRTMNIAFNWFMNTVAYYGISMATPSLGGNEFFSFIMISAIELPAYVFCMVVIDRLGRRMPLCMCMVIGGIASTLTYFVPSAPQYYCISIALALVAKFGAAAAFGIIYLFTVELFPTVVRNNGIGFCAMVGHIGGVISPYIATMSGINPALPLMIYGTCSLVAGLTALSLPETLNKELPDTVEDAEDFGRNDLQKAVLPKGAESERFYLLSDAHDDDDETVADSA